MPTASNPLIRRDLNGSWILDKTRGEWAMKQYLETMEVEPLAIEAHEKGDAETETIHTITLNRRRVTIVKQSRVNNNVTVELELGIERVDYLKPGDRVKRMIAHSENTGHLYIESSLQTYNGGLASVTDLKELVQEEASEGGEGQSRREARSVLKQQLTITNQKTQNTHSVLRYFVPYLETPPHLLE